MYKLLFLFILSTILFSSCLSGKKIIYVQNYQFSEVPEQIKNQRLLYKVQVNDVITVQVKSENQATDELFNQQIQAGPNINSDANLFLTGYSVDTDGNINMPKIGKVSVLGKDVMEIQKQVQDLLLKYFKDVTVTVRMVSFRVSILGEVLRPGVYNIFNNQANLLEAISLAGDLKDFANRKRIKLFRQKPEGSEVVLIDLTKADLLESKYYYLCPNDVLYVEPMKMKSARLNLPVVTAFFGGISATFIVLRFFFE